MLSAYWPKDYVEDLRAVTAACQDEQEIFTELAPLAQRLALNKAWVEECHYKSDPDQGFGVHALHEEPDHGPAVFVVAWSPGGGAPPHDHGTWAIVAGIKGFERNIRYARVDDGSKPGYAELEVKHDFEAGPGNLVLMKTGGIHEVRNESDQVTLSLHTYGRHVNYTQRSQFDLATKTEKPFLVKIA